MPSNIDLQKKRLRQELEELTELVTKIQKAKMGLKPTEALEKRKADLYSSIAARKQRIKDATSGLRRKK